MTAVIKRFFLYLLIPLMTLLRPLFPAWSVAYDQLPVDFRVESVSDLYAPAEATGAGVCEYPAVIQLRCQQNAADNG
ncbi:MAG: hypothetical protein IKD72_07990, partial [Clostridia bacterium]|nr:hypothetical protein [Clostridia bacterium]